MRNMTEEEKEETLFYYTLNSLDNSYNLINLEITKEKNEETISNVLRNKIHIQNCIKQDIYREKIKDIFKYTEIIMLAEEYINNN